MSDKATLIMELVLALACLNSDADDGEEGVILSLRLGAVCTSVAIRIAVGVDEKDRLRT